MTLRWSVERLGEVVSTQDAAAARAAAGAPEGTVVVAARQTAGRGRLGRRWESPPGGLYATAILRPPPEAAGRAFEIPLVAGLALAEALEGYGHAAMVKWPNDVLVAGRKVAGILAERRDDDRGPLVLLGLGVNCGAAPEGAPPPFAPVLAGGLGGSPSPGDLLAAFLDRFADRYAAWLRAGLGPLVRPLGARLAYRGARVGYVDGAERGEGTVLGLADSGALRLMTPAGERRLVSGEIAPRD